MTGALVLAFLLFAHSPTLRSGLLTRDYAGLLGEAPGPLVGAWAWASERLWGVPEPGASALGLRLELLATLLLCALALRLLLARLLEPRLGLPAARRAALTAALLFTFHPCALLASADVAARADLVALTLAAWACALFLIGRQEHADALTSASPILFLASGFASPVGAPLAAIVTLAEFACVRRHRKRSLRLRTATTTAAIFGAAAGLPLLLTPGSTLPEPGGVGLAGAGRTLMRLVLPSASDSVWPAALAGGVLLLSLWPAFRSARHAPRLWSGMLLAWSLALLVALALPLKRAFELSALAVWCAGLGLAVTAGWSAGSALRLGLVAFGLGLLAHTEVRPLPVRSRAEARLWAELAPLVRTHPTRILVLDPPDATAPQLGWLFHPRLLGDDAGAPSFSPERVRGLTSAAFLALTSSGALEALRLEGVAVVARTEAPGAGGSALSVRVLEPRAAATPERISWRGLTHTPAVPLDPLDWEAARFVADLAGTPRQIDQLGWDGRAGESGVLAGVVVERGGRFTAEFDLSGSLPWRLAGKVRSLRVERGVREIERAELVARLPELALAGAPVASGADWLFQRPPGDGGAGGSGAHALRLLALGDLELFELVPEPDGQGNLVARGAQAFRARKARGEVAWILDYRMGPRVVQRARGLVP